jgi:hypothetical protein
MEKKKSRRKKTKRSDTWRRSRQEDIKPGFCFVLGGR